MSFKQNQQENGNQSNNDQNNNISIKAENNNKNDQSIINNNHSLEYYSTRLNEKFDSIVQILNVGKSDFKMGYSVVKVTDNIYQQYKCFLGAECLYQKPLQVGTYKLQGAQFENNGKQGLQIVMRHQSIAQKIEINDIQQNKEIIQDNDNQKNNLLTESENKQQMNQNILLLITKVKCYQQIIDTKGTTSYNYKFNVMNEKEKEYQILFTQHNQQLISHFKLNKIILLFNVIVLEEEKLIIFTKKSKLIQDKKQIKEDINYKQIKIQQKQRQSQINRLQTFVSIENSK